MKFQIIIVVLLLLSTLTACHEEKAKLQISKVTIRDKDTVIMEKNYTYNAENYLEQISIIKDDALFMKTNYTWHKHGDLIKSVVSYSNSNKQKFPDLVTEYSYLKGQISKTKQNVVTNEEIKDGAISINKKAKQESMRTIDYNAGRIDKEEMSVVRFAEAELKHDTENEYAAFEEDEVKTTKCSFEYDKEYMKSKKCNIDGALEKVTLNKYQLGKNLDIITDKYISLKQALKISENTSFIINAAKEDVELEKIIFEKHTVILKNSDVSDDQKLQTSDEKIEFDYSYNEDGALIKVERTNWDENDVVDASKSFEFEIFYNKHQQIEEIRDSKGFIIEIEYNTKQIQGHPLAIPVKSEFGLQYFDLEGYVFLKGDVKQAL